MPTSRKASPRKTKKSNVSPAKKNPSAIISILCPDKEKPKTEKKPKKERKPEDPELKDCPRTKGYKSEADKRTYLEQEVIPILMEGMLGLAREMPKDPINYLEKFWLYNKHKCDIELPKNIL
ncbi:protein dpy-30 homolog [Drosophila ficusphila]|uniref:protein dpy-30 homolog n=1 Tax=Drosophila ficusphila TaxID=30025 RepID=UPI0007E8212B|nr:protein dpy-30 homolog [Drosophila ficusphila]